ncbi:progranulin isoform X2 [Octopus sinensis]|uniref:Progranulin isoform X2 n=1 Tax=Octopus sinensis TaxID=2607531 RepID=A0A6P7TMA1_9MOLL|nr:progranulin isoform X2 [Octopus sinensis]
MLYSLFAVLFLSAVQGGKLFYNRYDDLCSSKVATCTNGTCCLIGPNEYACCIYKNAECCSDRTHCCPEGYACDVKNGQCIKDGIKISWQNASIKKHKPTNDVEFTNRLNFFDRVFSHERTLKRNPKCHSNHTVCLLENEEFGCCPYPNAICCSGGEGLCCPNDHTCNVNSKKCEKSATKVAKAEDPLPKHLSDQICPDAQTSCSSNMTCCPLANGEYGCCPFSNAVCCNDHLHCCPQNSICDMSSQTCILQNDTNRLAKGSVYDMTQSRMMSRVEGGNSAPSSEAAAALPLVKDTLCPDNSSCSENDTCCAMNTGVWGCCSYTNAVCCADYMHCCPENFICDLNQKRCVKKGFLFLMSPLKTAKQAQAGATS